MAAVNATQVVVEMQNIQGAYPLAAMGVGRAMTGALLLASHLKEGQKVALHFRGNGPLGLIFAEADFDGKVRGYCPNPTYLAPETSDALKLGKALGFGTLNVSRHQPFQRQPFHGTVEMETGEIGDDIAHYLHQSHQIRSLTNLGVYLDKFGKVQSAGGILIEVMPGVDEEVVEKIQANADSLKSGEGISHKILAGATPASLLEPYIKGLPITEIPHDHEIQYFCPCTLDRVLRALGTLGQVELEEMIKEDKPSDIQCQMCGKSYQVQVPDLNDLLKELRKNALH